MLWHGSGERWIREPAACWIAIGMSTSGDAFVKVSTPSGASIWDVKLTFGEYFSFRREAEREGWRLEDPLY